MDNLDEADIVCYISCSYVKERIDKSITDIKELIANKSSHTKLAIFGCATAYTKFYDYFKDNKAIDYIGRGYGVDMQRELTQYLDKQKTSDIIYYPSIGYNLRNRKRLDIVIQDGCSKRCAFCKSNYLNFSLKSIPFEEIISAIKYFSDEFAITEVNLTGLNVSEYGLDLYKKLELTKLIRSISEIPTIKSIMLDSLCPDNINHELLNEILSNPKIKRVMIPIQSMDDDMLKLMGRRNTAKEARDILSTISTYRPDIFIETIFLVCYPTETTKVADKNIELLENVRIHNPAIFLYVYGTNVPSLKSEQIAVMTKEERYALQLYYYENMISLIERQRKELLSRPVEGTLIYKDDTKDYYSTIYRFTTNELTIICPPNEMKLGDKALIDTDFVDRVPNMFYATSAEYGKGRVLRKI